MKFISPIQNKPAAALQSVKAAPPSQKSFSNIFASELHSLSIVPNKSSADVFSAKNSIALTSQNMPGVAMTSFSQLFPNLAVHPGGSANEQNKSAASVAAANKIVPGIVNLPIANMSAVAKIDRDLVDKKTGSIDIAGIVNFHNASPKATRPATQAGTIASIGDNPSVVISRRSKTPSNEWARYHMESSTQGQQGGVLAGGVMMAFRVEIG